MLMPEKMKAVLEAAMKAEKALFEIEEPDLFFSTVATIVDEYAIEKGLTDDDVTEWYKAILEVRPGVIEKMKGESA